MENNSTQFKIAFLQKENEQLLDRVTDLEDMVRLNKEALRVASGLTDKSQLTTERSLLATNLFSQIERIMETLKRVTEERDLTQSKCLLFEQICEEVNRREKENVEEHKEKLKDFAFNLHEKDTIISEIQTQNGIQESDGFITIFRDVLNILSKLVRPKEENVRLMNEIETMKSILNLANELNRMRMAFASPLNSMKQTSDTPNDFPSINTNAMLSHSSESEGDEDSFLGSDHSDEKPSPAQENKKPVPKLDLSGATKIQEIYAKRTSQQNQTKEFQNLDKKIQDKIKALETDLHKSKRLLQKEMTSNKLLCQENRKLIRSLDESSSQNEILVIAQARYEKKWKQIYTQYEFFRKFYFRNINYILGLIESKEAESNPVIKGLLEHLHELNHDIQAFENKEEIKDVNVSILEFKKNPNQNEVNMLMEGEGECQKSINVLVDIRKEPPPSKKTHVRSLSNPLDYVQQEKTSFLKNWGNHVSKKLKLDDITSKRD